MEKVNVHFVNFWKGFEEQSYVFLELFQKRYRQERVTNNPDVVFYADRIKKKQRKVDFNSPGVKVWYTGENHSPPPRFDYSFSFEPTTDTNFQLPIFARCKYYFDFLNQTERNRYQQTKKHRFCNFIYRNRQAQERIRFCKRFQKRAHIDCPGEVLNNMPNFTREGRRARDWLTDKLKFISQYKFTIAFENERSENYVTEKLFDPLYVGSIPIYWGAPNVGEFFNPDSFINVSDFDSFDDVIQYVKEVNNNDELYNKMLNAPAIHNTSRLNECTEENILARFEEIVCHTR